MKFKDIPKFTQRPTYHINADIDYIEEWVKNNIEELGLQMNPDFQRGHVWTKEQQTAYMEYLLRGGSSGKDFYFNRVGGMHDFGNTKSYFVCVDGLQRITAIIGFLHDEVPVFGHFRKDFEDKLRMSDVVLSIYVNDLKTKKDVLIWYVEMNSGGTPHTQEEINRVKKMLEDENK